MLFLYVMLIQVCMLTLTLTSIRGTMHLPQILIPRSDLHV